MDYALRLRAWDLDNEVMILPPHPVSSNAGPTITFDGRLYINGVHQNLVLQLSTNENDVEGTEIFVGDIVENGQYNGSCGLGVIVFRFGEFYALPLWKFAEGIMSYGMFPRSKVIGNIYENKDLIMPDKQQGE